jgi:tRNA modification GTPase
MFYNTEDTIAAISTPPGEGGIAVIRISGEESVAVANKIFSGDVSKIASHTAHYGHITSIDTVLLLVMRSPRSYTGEDVVEINCHGGSLISRKVLETVLEAGARAALPGEFTFRAFINGKLDLAQAEAVQELIAAKNEIAVMSASGQLQGALSQKVMSFQKEMTGIAAMIEAWVDFPEEDLEFADVKQVCFSLEKVSKSIKELIKTFHDGRLLHEGLSLCLIGSTNVGKSSLMNALLGKDRAIVTEQPGTTRDILEDSLLLGGLNFKLVDTAGLRDSSCEIEKEGIRRSKKAMKQADLILFVLDCALGINEKEKEILSGLPSNKTIVVWNKQDLSRGETPPLSVKNEVKVSALKKTGLEELKKSIDNVVWDKGPPDKGEVLITSLRHKEALEEAVDSCEKVIEGLKNKISPEFVSFDMRQTLTSLGRILGTDVTEDILSAIFSKFCIGK